jgi:xanthine dehydrogenase YagS FAD-binding subunit
MIAFDFVRATTTTNAVDALTKNKNARFIAGGTNLVDLMKKGVANPEKLIDINGLDLRFIQEEGRRLRIGALALNSAVAAHPVIGENYPLIAQAIHAGASAQIRNMATTGGNLLQRTRCPYFNETKLPCNKREPGSGCSALQGFTRMHAIFGASEQCIAVHPSDFAVALAACNASVVTEGPKGLKGRLATPIQDFYRLPGTTPQLDTNLKPNELIVEVSVPLPPSTQSHYLKIRDRASYAFALVSVAAVTPLVNTGGKSVLRDVRLAIGGVAHKPWRLTAVEKMLEGQAPSESLFKKVAAESVKGAKGYGGNNFKLKLLPLALVQALKASTKIS